MQPMLSSHVPEATVKYPWMVIIVCHVCRYRGWIAWYMVCTRRIRIAMGIVDERTMDKGKGILALVMDRRQYTMLTASVLV